MTNRIKRCSGLLVALLLVSFFTSSLTYAEDTSVKAWANVYIDSSYPSKLTPQVINDFIAANGASEKARNGKLGDIIFDVANVNGINPAIIFSMFWHETAKGGDWKWVDANNPGGIRCKEGYPCQRKEGCSDCALWTKFTSVEQGFQVKAELLRSYIDKRNLRTIEQVLLTYAPPSDNNDLYTEGQGYIWAISRNSGYLGLTISDFTDSLTPTNGTYSDGTAGGTWKAQDFFMTSTINADMQVVDKGEDIPSIISYAFKRFAHWSSSKLHYVMVVLSLGLLVYISLMILSYTLIVKGTASNGGLFRKLIVINGDIYGKSALMKVFAQSAIGILIVALVLSGMYLYLMGAVYTLWEQLLDYLGL